VELFPSLMNLHSVMIPNPDSLIKWFNRWHLRSSGMSRSLDW